MKKKRQRGIVEEEEDFKKKKILIIFTFISSFWLVHLHQAIKYFQISIVIYRHLVYYRIYMYSYGGFGHDCSVCRTYTIYM